MNNKKKITIFFNCHGGQIMYYLNLNNELRNKYTTTIISVNAYIKSDLSALSDEHKKKIEECDVLILQVIEKNRGYLNNDQIIKLCKKECLVIKIPHYRNSIYYHKTLENNFTKNTLNNWILKNEINIDNIDETIKLINEEIKIMNEFPYNEKELKKDFFEKFNEFEKIDSLSTIKMLDYFQNNYDKYKLFQSRSYPSSIFFYELTNRILKKIGIFSEEKFVDTYFAHNTFEPTAHYWYIFCNFKFENKYLLAYGIEVMDYEWFYILLLTNGENITDKNINLTHLKKIRKLQ
jgi:hypothetical protein